MCVLVCIYYFIFSQTSIYATVVFMACPSHYHTFLRSIVNLISQTVHE